MSSRVHAFEPHNIPVRNFKGLIEVSTLEPDKPGSATYCMGWGMFWTLTVLISEAGTAIPVLWAVEAVIEL